MNHFNISAIALALGFAFSTGGMAGNAKDVCMKEAKARFGK